jgi:hypothetical protein
MAAKNSNFPPFGFLFKSVAQKTSLMPHRTKFGQEWIMLVHMICLKKQTLEKKIRMYFLLGTCFTNIPSIKPWVKIFEFVKLTVTLYFSVLFFTF